MADTWSSAEIFLDSMKELDVENPHLLVDDGDRVEKLKKYLPVIHAFFLDLRGLLMDNMYNEWGMNERISDANFKARPIVREWDLYERICHATFKVKNNVLASMRGESLGETPLESLLEEIRNIYTDINKDMNYKAQQAAESLLQTPPHQSLLEEIKNINQDVQPGCINIED